MELLMHEGRSLSVPAIERGPRLVDTEDQWRERQRGLASRVVVMFLWSVIGVYLAMFAFIGLTTASADWSGFWVVVAFPLPVVLGGALLLYAILMVSARPRPAMPGVYHLGIQLPPSNVLFEPVFVPFGQIVGERKVGSSALTGYVFLDVMGLPRPVRLSPRVFGREGVEVVRAMLAGKVASTRPPGAPRLNVHGPAERQD